MQKRFQHEENDAQFVELFEFMKDGNIAVRKGAIQGLASHSKDNVPLQQFLVRNTTALPTLLGLLRLEDADALAGDTLAVLINTSVEFGVSDALARQAIVPKAMRFLEALAQHEEKMKNSLALAEMFLMLLNNVTARSQCAVDSLLQLEDDSMKGYHLSQLFQHSQSLSKRSPRAATWSLQIVLNSTRTRGGQECVVNDDDWMAEVANAIGGEETTENSVAALGVIRNCSKNKRCHAKLLQHSTGKLVLRRLCAGRQRDTEGQKSIIETLAGLMASESGVQFMEECNAKQQLLASRDRLDPAAQQLLDEAVIRFLDDIVDVYANQ